MLTGRARLRFMGITFPGRYRIVHDPVSGCLPLLETMGYKEEVDEQKVLWINRVEGWQGF